VFKSLICYIKRSYSRVTYTVEAMVTHLPLLTPEECGRVLEGIQAQKKIWEPRYPGLPFYTLGAASYLDSGPGRHGYDAKAARFNPLLEQEFGWLYERLLGALRSHLGEKVTFEPRAARPGFHIFLAHEAFRRPLGKIHFDLQYSGITWEVESKPDFSQPLSYTVAIRLPRAGAGLHLWDITKAEYDASGMTDLEAVSRERAPDYIPYKEGAMVYHSGLLLHRIAPARGGIRPDDMRVTLQGHALLGRDGYRLYW